MTLQNNIITAIIIIISIKKDALANLSFGEINIQQLLNVFQQNQFIQYRNSLFKESIHLSLR